MLPFPAPPSHPDAMSPVLNPYYRDLTQTFLPPPAPTQIRIPQMEMAPPQGNAGQLRWPWGAGRPVREETRRQKEKPKSSKEVYKFVD